MGSEAREEFAAVVQAWGDRLVLISWDLPSFSMDSPAFLSPRQARRVGHLVLIREGGPKLDCRRWRERNAIKVVDTVKG